MAALVLGAGYATTAADEAFAKLNGDVIATVHFVGTAQIAADPGAAELNKLAEPVTMTAFRNATLDKFSTAPYRFLRPKIDPQNTNDFAALLRPILDDLLASESYYELRGVTNRMPDLMLAVRLKPDHATLWDAYLSTVISSWTGIHPTQIQGDGFTGWEIKKHDEPNLIHFIHAGDWVLIGWGQDEIRLQQVFLDRIKTAKSPAGSAKDIWLDATVDLPAILAQHPISLSVPLPVNLPKMHLTVEGRTNFVRPKLTMLFPQPLDIKLDQWKIPFSIIHSPIISFTAVRGIAPWLNEVPEVKALHAPSVPDQIIAWSKQGTPFDSYIAAPLDGASNYLAQLAPKILAEYNAKVTNRLFAKALTWQNNRFKLSFPYMSPYFTAAHEHEGDFLLGGLFPAPQSQISPPLPLGLMREIGSKPNLVYYGWEINAERLGQWNSINEIRRMTSYQFGPPPSAPAYAWLISVKTNLGSCATELMLTATNELTLIRNGPLGLTGHEMSELEYWLDSPEFPLSSQYPKPVFSTNSPATK